MTKKRTLMRYYKKKHYKGRTLFARAIDFIALRLIGAAACYLWFTGLMENTVMAVLLSLTAILTVSVGAELYKSIRLDKFILMERELISTKLFREKLFLMPEAKFKELARCYVKANYSALPFEPFILARQTASSVDEDTVLSVYRGAKKHGYIEALIFTSSEVTAKATELAHHCSDVDFSFITPKELAMFGKSIDLTPSDDEIDAYIIEKVNNSKLKNRKKSLDPLNSNRTKRYLLVAIGLFAASFFVDYPIYYRLMSAACLSFGTAAWWLNNLGNTDSGKATGL